MSERALVELQGVSKGFGVGSTRVEVLRGLDLDVPEGQLLAVVGPSGVGKSTLLHLIGLLDRPDDGRLTLDGDDVGLFDGETRAHLRNRMIGFVFQYHYLLDELDARDNIALPLRIAGKGAAAARARADELLEAVSLTGRAHHFPDQLSGGEQQRVAVARALAMKPRLLLADEPTGNLDGDTGHAVIDLLVALNTEARTTLVLVTHDQELAQRAHEVVRLSGGKLVA